MARAVAASVLLGAVVALGIPGQVAAGSGGQVLDLHTSFSVFLRAGEILDMRSTSGDITVASPSGIALPCAAPCAVRATVTGVYRATPGPSASFDPGVRGGAGEPQDIPGRVFTYALAGTAGATALSLRYYLTTTDGYRYRVDSREPAGSPFTVRAHGLPLSFAPLAPETLQALGIPTTPVTPDLTAATFAGDIAATNATVGGGGRFEVTGTGGTFYEVVVSRDDHDSPVRVGNRVILAAGGAGPRTITWDGRDNRGAPFPAGPAYPFRVSLHAGVYRPDDPGHPVPTLLDSDFTASADAATGGVSVATAPVAGTLTVVADPGAAPTASVDSLTTPGGTSAAVPSPGLLGNDTGTGLEVTATGTPAHGTVTVDPDGAYVYTPTASYSGVDSFAYTTTDSLGRTATARAGVQVRPAARDDVRATPFETPIEVAALANDAGTALRLAGVDQPPAGQGRAALDGGRVRYTPPRGFTGVASFSYTTVDATGQRSSAGVHVSVAFPVVPTAAPDTDVTPADTATSIDIPGVLANDTGVRLIVIGTSNPAHGTVRVAPDGSYVYTPDRGFAGVDLFAYVVRDAVGRTSASTVAVTVLPPAQDDREVGLVGHPITLDPLANDAAGPSVALLRSSLRLVDPVGGTQVLAVAVARQGTYTINPDGTVTFAPLAGFRGTPTPVRYEVRDTAGQVSGAMIEVSYTTGIGGATIALNPLIRGAAAALLVGLLLVAAAAYRPREHGRHRAS